MALLLSVLASWTSSVAAKGPDSSCLLQTMAGQNRQNLSDGLSLPDGWTVFCQDCQCANQVTFLSENSLDPCIAHCQAGGYPVVAFQEASATCLCCGDTNQLPQNSAYSGINMYQFQETTSTSTTSTSTTSTSTGYNIQQSSAEAIGDPHIKTLDGRSYTLVSQGTFLLWHLAMETEWPFQSGGESEFKRAPVEWQIYAHYSGHQSFTKGLLLVDISGGSHKMLEITSQKCEWRARKGHQEWIAVKSSDSELISLDAAGNDVTTFNLVTTNGAKFHNQVHMNMKTKVGKTDIAVLRLSCRPNHNLNLHLTMERRSDMKQVEGEVKMARKALSTLQTSTSTDSEFKAAKKWQDLGGSDEAAAYLHRVDELMLIQADMSKLQECNSQEEKEFEKTCSKHLRAMGSHAIAEATFTDFLSDCIYDMCRGAGETAAELAAELLASTAS